MKAALAVVANDHAAEAKARCACVSIGQFSPGWELSVGHCIALPMHILRERDGEVIVVTVLAAAITRVELQIRRRHDRNSTIIW